MAAVEKDFRVKNGIIVENGVITTPASSASIYSTSPSVSVGSGSVTIPGGSLILGGTGRIEGIDTVTAATDAASKSYVDTVAAAATVSIADQSTLNATVYIPFTDQTSGAENTLGIDTGLTYNPFSGVLSAATFNGPHTGNSTTATTLQTARTISLTGDVSGSVSFNGSSNASITATIQPNSVALGTDTVGDYVSTLTAGGAITITGATGEGSNPTISHTDTSNQATVTNTAGNVIQSVAVDTYGHITSITSTNLDSRFLALSGGSLTGGLTVGTDLIVSGNLTVNGSTVSINSTVTSVDDPITLLGDGSTATNDGKDRGIEYKYGNGTVIKTGFFGFDNSTGYFTFIPDSTNAAEVISGAAGDIQAANFRGNLIGNSTTATALQTARTISLSGDASGSVSFNGSSNVSLSVTVLDDSHTHTNINNNLAIGGVLTVTNGSLVLGGTGRIEGIDTVTAATDAASKSYVDTVVAAANPQTTTTVLSAAGTIFTFPIATFRSARIAIQASHTTAGFEIIEIAMIHNGVDVHYSEYANVFTISTLFDTSINVVSGNVVVTATPVNTNTTFRVIPQTLTAI